VYRSLGMYDEAFPLLRKALAIRKDRLGADHLDVAASLHHLGWLEHDRGDYREAERLVREAFTLRRRHLGPDHLVTAASMFNLAWLLTDRGKVEEAEDLFRKVLYLRKEELGADHRETAIALGGLVALLLHSERYFEAAPLVVEGYDVLRKLNGEEPVLAIGLYQKAINARGAKQYKEAERLTQECLKLLHKLGCDEHPFAAFVQFELWQ